MEHLVFFNDFTVVFLCNTLFFFKFAIPVLRDLRSETTLTKAETQPWSNPLEQPFSTFEGLYILLHREFLYIIILDYLLYYIIIVSFTSHQTIIPWHIH